MTGPTGAEPAMAGGARIPGKYLCACTSMKASPCWRLLPVPVQVDEP